MAAMLYESLHYILLMLDDRVEVWPAHGAGSLCGRNISNETSSTIGQQRLFNYALQPMPMEDFVKMMTADLPAAPPYFSKDAEINRQGARSLDELPRPEGLSPDEVHELAKQGAAILDMRPSSSFGAGHIPGALNLGLNGQFASWAGSLLKLDAPIVVVGEDGNQIDESVTRLARVGIENVKGYLDGGMYAWNEAGLETAAILQIPVDELKHRLDEEEDLQILDVRQPGEYYNGHVPKALNSPLASLVELVPALNELRPTAVICAGGYRSSVATSILARLGFKNLYNVVGGTSAWVNAGYPVD
jgi:rhodanese-related sulfurtransferase